MAKDPPYRVKNMMPGMIMLWAGSVATIPSGWTFCDGTMGTPNLKGRFVIGAFPPLLNPDAIGGSVNHDHDFTGDGHAHDLAAGVAIEGGLIDGDYIHQTDTSPASGTTNEADSRPPYYSLCYIMKL